MNARRSTPLEVAQVLRATRSTEGQWQALCPSHDDKEPSLSIGAGRDGKVLLHCFAGCDPANVIDALERDHGLTVRSHKSGGGSSRTVGKRAGATARGSAATTADPATPRAPARGNDKDDAAFTPIVPPPPGESWEHSALVGAPRGEFVAAYEYRNAAGEMEGIVRRLEHTDADGKRVKEIRPLRYGTVRGFAAWYARGWGDGRPLYRLPQLLAAADAPVLVVEGEKAADAAARLFPDHVATSPMGGAQSPGRTAWSPLRGRQVTVWPDHDAAGAKFAAQVAELATSAGAASVRIVQVPDSFAAKWDLADAPPENADLRALLESAEPWTSPKADAQPAELQEIATFYPLPELESLRLVYRHSASGKIRVHKMVESPNSTLQYIPIATPFGVPARLRHVDQADAYGLRCLVQDMNGQPRAIDFERAALAKLAASEVRGQLFGAGLRTEADGEMIAVACLKAADPAREILVFRRPGWQEAPGLAHPVFLCPDGHVIGAPDGLDLELSAAERMPSAVAMAGELDGWKHAVANAVLVPGCPHWVLGVVAAFAGPIIALTGIDTCGISFSGMTSSGKSTAQRLAASAWSTPDIRKPGLCQSARATDNAIEALASRAAGSVLCLDELAHVPGKTAAKMIYTIAGGVGKRRMSADAVIRQSYTWSTFAILSGESSLEEKIRADGGEWSAGMAVRILDIDVTDINRHVDAETLRAINSIEQNHGHAGPAFVKALTASGLHRQATALRERVLKAARALSGEDADSALVRAAVPLATLLIASELAKSVGLLPPATPVQEAVGWAWQRFRHSSDASALDPETQVIDAIRAWIGERWNVTIKDVDAESGINNREAAAWYDDIAVYLPKSRLREAAGNNLRESQVASILDRRGLLARRTEADRLCVRFVPKVGRIVSYALRRSEFGRTHASTDPEALHIHSGGNHV